MSADTVSAAAWVSDTPAAAWSACEPPEPAVYVPPRWSNAWARVAAAAVAVGSAAGAVLLLLNPPASAAVVVAAPPAAAVTVDPESLKNADPGPFVMPTAMAVQETADGQYLTMMNHIPGKIVNDPAKSERYGHGVCRGIENSGDSISDATTQIEELSRGSGWSTEQVHALVLAAVTAYCPQFLERP